MHKHKQHIASAKSPPNKTELEQELLKNFIAQLQSHPGWFDYNELQAKKYLASLEKPTKISLLRQSSMSQENCFAFSVTTYIPGLNPSYESQRFIPQYEMFSKQVVIYEETEQGLILKYPVKEKFFMDFQFTPNPQKKSESHAPLRIAPGM